MIRGLNFVRRVLGRPLTGVRRFVLGLGSMNDAFGHGITEFTFDDLQLVIAPGPDEDYLVVELGAIDPKWINHEYYPAFLTE